MNEGQRGQEVAYVDAALNGGEHLRLEVGGGTNGEAVREASDSEQMTCAVIDFEGTAANPERAEPIECAIAMVRIESATGAVINVERRGSWLQEPAEPISTEIEELTGIGDATVRGHRFDVVAIEALLDSADVVLAHNANYDRTLLEKVTGERADLWVCTYTDVSWRRMQILGRSLGALCASHGRVWPAHRATNDVAALTWLIGQRHRNRSDGAAIAKSAVEHAHEASVLVACETQGYPGEKYVALMKTCMRWSPDAKLWWRDARPQPGESADTIIDAWARIFAHEWQVPRARIVSGRIEATARHRTITDPRPWLTNAQDASMRAGAQRLGT